VNSTNPARPAYTEFIAALAGNLPHPIHRDPNWDALEHRADHLRRVFAALHVYLTATVAKTAQDIPANSLDRRYLESLFQQFSGDVLGAIRDAAAEMRGHESWRAL
jgi:hypothetical protein